MAFTNYVPPLLNREQAGALPDLIGNLLSGYSDVYKARMMPQDLIKKKLENKYYGPNMESQIGLRGAQAGHLGAMTEGLNISNPFLREKLEQEQRKREFELKNPFFGQTGTSGDLGRLISLQNMIKNNPELAQQLEGGESPENPIDQLIQGQSYIPPMQNTMPDQNNFNKMIQDAFSKITKPTVSKTIPQSVTVKDLNALTDAEDGFVPGTDRTQTFDTREAQKRYIEGLKEKTTSLKKGNHYVYDEKTGEEIGIRTPLSEPEKKVYYGRENFKQLFPYIRHGFEDFAGKGSINNLYKFAHNYGKDAHATKKIDDFLLAQALVTGGVVNEAGTLRAANTNQTYNRLTKSLNPTDIPHIVNKLVNDFKLPPAAFSKMQRRFQNIMLKATDRALNSVPATKVQYHHPEKFLKGKEKKSEHKITKDNDPLGIRKFL